MRKDNLYIRYIKPAAGRFLAFLGFFLFWWLYLLIAAAIVIDDPGPVIFRQKRVGKKRNGKLTYFYIWKFRTMRTDTPQNVPTHLLDHPEKYITGVGRILRRTSLDELPQLWNIGVEGTLAWIGPRPALYNQKDLVREREKYGVNDVMPGLTGWAQINGRDELAIPEKARLDGEYVRDLRRGNLSALRMDITCILGTVRAVLKADGIREGKA